MNGRWNFYHVYLVIIFYILCLSLVFISNTKLCEIKFPVSIEKKMVIGKHRQNHGVQQKIHALRFLYTECFVP